MSTKITARNRILDIEKIDRRSNDPITLEAFQYMDGEIGINVLINTDSGQSCEIILSQAEARVLSDWIIRYTDPVYPHGE